MRGISSSFCCFMSKKEQKVRFQREIEQKTQYNTATIFLNVTFFMRGTKGGNSDQLSAKTPCARAIILKKCNVFFRLLHSLFLAVFCQKKEEKVRYHTIFQQNPLYHSYNFEKMQRFFCLVHNLFLAVFYLKKNKR